MYHQLQFMQPLIGYLWKAYLKLTVKKRTMLLFLEIAEESFPLVNNDMKNNAPLSTQQFKIIKKSQPGTQVKVPLLGSTHESSPAINKK